MKKTLYLMRHGQTTFNLKKKIQGFIDSPLTELGIQQALNTKKYIDTLDIDHAYASTSERASDTLELVLGNRLSYTRLKALKEMNFGSFEGESEELNPKDRTLMEDFFIPYGGERQSDVQKRMVETITDIMNKEDHQQVLIVSHAGASVGFISAFLNPRDIFQKGFPNASVLQFEYEEGLFKFIDMFAPED